MRKEISEKIKIPAGIEVEIDKRMIKLKKEGKEISREYSGCSVKKENDELLLYCKKATKREKKQIKTLIAHIKNMIRGLENKFSYKLQICSVHFPMSVSIDKEKREVLIKNFLGEVKPRVARVSNDVDVKIEKEIITVESYDKEKAGQTAANIEKAGKIRNRDRRTFQDGIFITEKPE